MKKRGLFRVVLALLLCCSMTVNVFATETSGEVEVETSAGTTEIVEVEITIEETPNSDGSTTVRTESGTEGYVTGDGMIVDYESSSSVTTQQGGAYTGESSEEYVSENEDGSYIAQGGSETTYTENTLEITIQIPLSPEDNPETEEDESTVTVTGDETGTVLDTEGDVPESAEDGEYDYTSTTVDRQGSVTVTTGGSTTTGEFSADGIGMDHVSSQTTPTADNDLFTETNSSADIPGEGDPLPEAAEGYRYVYIGTGNNSQYWGTYLFETPSEDYPDEEPVYVDADGTPYYLRRPHNINKRYWVEGLYIDGERVEEDTQFPAIYDSIQQFVMVDPVTGEIMTTYCADRETPAEDGYSYNMENLEDASYYTEEEAAMIRTVAMNGYWGVLDDETTEEAEMGSLEAMRQMMAAAVDAEGNPVFTEEEIQLLNDGIAMTATQFAIWSYSNYMSGVEFVNAHYIRKNANNEYSHTGAGSLKDIPEEEQASVDLAFKLYNHLVNMEPTSVEESTTANTVITPSTFLEDLTLTVVEKAADHVNNQDGDGTNDAYVTNLSFALVVTPAEDNGDDLMVYVLDVDGNILASGRIAGEAQEGETLLRPDEEGNYTLRDIVLVEGEQNFHITLEGVQNLEQGVYLYSSEVVDGVSSQTMVGIAEGSREVDVSMNINFELTVEQEVVATTHVWREERTVIPPTPPIWTPPVTPPVTPPSGGQEDPPETPPTSSDELEIGDLVEIPDTPVPLADIDVNAPKTGDTSIFWMLLSALSGTGLALLGLLGKGSRAPSAVEEEEAAPEEGGSGSSHPENAEEPAPPGGVAPKGGNSPPGL